MTRTFQNKRFEGDSLRARCWHRKRHRFSALGLVVLCLVSTPAQSFAPRDILPYQGLSAGPATMLFPLLAPEEFSSLTKAFPSTVDSCLPLLNSIALNPPTIADGSRRPAGTAAAKASVLGLVFGVRYALGPPQVTRMNSDVQNAHAASPGTNGHALAVSDYRACQKKQALSALRRNGEIILADQGHRMK